MTISQKKKKRNHESGLQNAGEQLVSKYKMRVTGVNIGVSAQKTTESKTKKHGLDHMVI